MKRFSVRMCGFVIVLITITTITFISYRDRLLSKNLFGNDLHTEDTRQINVALWDYEVVGYDKKLIEEFSKYYPNIKVNVINIPNNNYDNSINMLLSMGKDIDVFYVRTPAEYKKIVQNDFARPLNDLIERDKIKTSPYEKNLKVNNNIYGIPYRSDFLVLYYNRDIFDKNNVPYPTNYTTWSEYRELAKRLTSRHTKDKEYGFFIEPQFVYTVIFSMIDSPNYNILESDLNLLREGLEFMINIQYVDRSSAEYATNKSLHANQLVFTQGHSATSINGTWFLNYLFNGQKVGTVNFNWGMVSYPYYKEKKANEIIYTPVCINKKSNNVEASWEFVKFIASKEAAKILAKEMILPAYIDDNIIEIFKENSTFPETGIELLRNYTVKPYMETGDLYSQVHKMIREEIELVITHNQSINTGIANMIQKRQDIIYNTKTK